METDLLMRLKQLTGVGYLSDLRSVPGGRALYDAVMTVRPEEYDLKEWEEAIRYILNKEKLYFKNAQDAREFLCGQIQAEFM